MTASQLTALRACLDTLRPYTGRPIGGEGSPARRHQLDQADAYAEAITILDALEQETKS